MCKKSFKNSNSLSAHMSQTCKKKIVKIDCEYCGIKVLLLNLNDHIKTEHGERVKCPICKGSFKNDNSLHTHIYKTCRQKTEKIKCEICGEVVMTKDIILHIKLHKIQQNRQLIKKQKRVKRRICPNEGCNKSFKNAASLNSHISQVCNIPKIQCSFCGKHFLPKDISVHIRQRHVIETIWT